MEFTSVFIKPVLTEKTYYASLTDQKKKYYFQVDVKATKTIVRQAFFAIYGINPLQVNMLLRKSVRTKTGTRRPGYTPLQKIAIITLPPGVEILVTGEKPADKEKDKGEKKE